MNYTNHYVCPECGARWSDTWDSFVNDDCPDCGIRHIEPTYSVDEEGETINHCGAIACHSCKELTPPGSLDSKPAEGVDDPEGNTEWSRLECQKCYGESFVGSP